MARKSNREDTQEVHCKECGGMKILIVNGKAVDPMKWINHGYAVDIGCICNG